MSQQKVFPLPVQLAVITLARLCLNTGLRTIYPFVPALARGLDVPIELIYRLVALRNVAGFLSPLFSPLSERFGRRPVIAGSATLMGAGCLLVVIWPAYWPLGVTLVLIAVAKVIFDPAIQAYIGDVVPYRQRGKAIAATELSWAGALLVGAPAVGFTIQRYGWQAPFLWLGLLALASAVLIWQIVPTSGKGATRATGLMQTFRIVRQHPVIWAAALYVMLVMGANEILFIVYGAWMEVSFALTLTTLGIASGIIGGAEIMGEVIAGWSVDRFGKRPVIITTGLLSVAAYLIIPFTSNVLTLALAALFFLFLVFEITAVGGIPLMTELVPAARGIVMSMLLATGALGRAIGSLVGPFIWETGGFIANGFVSASIGLCAVVILALWVHEGPDARELQFRIGD